MALVPAIKRGESRFLDTIKELADPRPMISDAYWSATHPIDRMAGRGRSSGPQMLMYPWGSKFPPKWFPVGPPEAGLHAVRLPVSRNVPLDAKTKDALTWRGNLMGTNYFQNPQRGIPRTSDQRTHYAIEAAREAARRPSSRTPTGGVRHETRKDNGTPVSYNIINDEGKVVGSSHMQFYPDKTEVKEVFLKPEYQGNLEIFRDMVGPALDRGVPVDAVAGNPKIGRVLSRMAQRGQKSGNAGVVESWNRNVPRGQWGRADSTRRGRTPHRVGGTDAYWAERGRIAGEKGQPFLEDLLDLGTDFQTQRLRDRRMDTGPVPELDLGNYGSAPWYREHPDMAPRPVDPARQQLRDYAPANDVPPHILDAYGRGARKTPAELAEVRAAGRNIQQASYRRAVEEHQAMLARRGRRPVNPVTHNSGLTQAEQDAIALRARRYRAEELARQRRGLGRRGGE